MSKQPIDPMSGPGDDLPPPYTPAFGTDPAGSRPQYTTPGEAASLFTVQLSNLRATVHSQQTAQASARDQHDDRILALLVPHVEDFISSIATYSPLPSQAETILIPSGAVGDDWQLSAEQEIGEGETREVVFVEPHNKLRGIDSKAGGGSSSGSDGDHLWWTNETLAARLARHLQPESSEPRQPAVASSSSSAPPARQEKKKTSRWRLFGSRDTSAESAPSSSSSGSAAPSRTSRANVENVKMTVRAEEVTFRRENEFGVWESKTGWGIIVQLRLPRA